MAQESGVQGRFITWFRTKFRGDGMIRNCGAGTAGHVNGDPDVYGVLDGLPFVLEFKQPGEKPTKMQMHRLRQWRDAACPAAWTDSLEAAQLWTQSGFDYRRVDPYTLRLDRVIHKT